MDLATLRAFFGWMSVINILMLAFAAGFLTLGRSWVMRIHSRLTGLADEQLKQLYVNWLANYKIAILVLNLAPYLALYLIT